MGLPLRLVMTATAVLAAAIAFAFSVAPEPFAYRSVAGHVAIETAAGLISLLVAFIVGGRFLQNGRVTDLVMAMSLAILGISNLFFSAVPAAAGSGFGRWATWAPVSGRLLASLGFAAAAWAGNARIRRPHAAMLPATAYAGAGLGLIALVFAFVAPRTGFDATLDPSGAGHPRVVGDAAILTVQLIQAVAYAAAAIGFACRSERTGDPLMGWLAVAAVLAAFAHVSYFVFPSLYSEWLYTGDYLRVGFYLVLFAGAANQIQRYQAGLAQTAALEERRRLARELHDGLAQELAFIATQTRWLARRVDGEHSMDQLVVAAERALDESRSAISALTRPMDEPLDAALAQAAEEVAGRVGVRLRLDLEEGIEVPPSTREALIRIVREAVSNTARHGQANCVTIELLGGNGVRLRVEDDGIGFEMGGQDGGAGFGLTSMRERARALGADFSVESSPGSGTQIEVVLP